MEPKNNGMSFRMFSIHIQFSSPTDAPDKNDEFQVKILHKNTKYMLRFVCSKINIFHCKRKTFVIKMRYKMNFRREMSLKKVKKI